MIYVSDLCNFCVIYVSDLCNFSVIYVSDLCNFCVIYVSDLCNFRVIYVSDLCNFRVIHFVSQMSELYNFRTLIFHMDCVLYLSDFIIQSSLFRRLCWGFAVLDGGGLPVEFLPRSPGVVRKGQDHHNLC